MAEEDILTAAASGTQQMIPQMKGNLTQFGPTPLIAPPAPITFQPPPVQYGQPTGGFSSVGERQRADKEALFHGVAGLIKSGSDYIQAKRQRALTMDITRLMEAQQGIQEAKQILQQDPNNQQAKEGLQRNTALINDITSDPKKLKQLQKAYNIDLFGGGKNKNENQALVNAWKEFGQKQQAGDKSALNPMAQRLMAQQPWRQQLSPEAQQQAAAIQAGLLPKAGEILKANLDMYKTIASVKTAEERDIALEKAADIRAQAEKYHADKLVDAANTRALGQATAQEIASRARIKVAEMTSATWDKRLGVMKDIAASKTGNPFFKNLFQQATTYNNELTRLIQENKAAQVELDKKGTSILGFKISAASGADAKILRQKIMMNNFRIKDIENDLSSIQNQMTMLNKFGVNVGMGGSNESTDVGTEDQPIEVNEEDQ